jgi:Ca2+-binding EF-hand superfamily protein
MVEEEKEFIDFNEIKKIISVENGNLFLVYLKEIYKDLADRNETNRKKGIMKIIFLDYLKLPMFISEKLFSVFDEDNDGFLNSKEFIFGMNRLYNGSYQDTIKLIFELLDFNHDGFIEKDDAKMILSLLPLKTDKCKVEYKYQMESLEEINEIINSTFGKSKKLNLEEFQNTVENKKSDIFIQIICFLYQKKPFTEKSISVLKSSKKVVPNDLILQTPQVKNKDSCGNILLPSPLKNTSLSPASIFLKSNMISSPFSLGESAGIEEESEPAISGFNGMVRYHNRNIPKNGGNEEEDNNDVNKIIQNSDGVYNSPSVYLKRHKAKAVKPFSLSSPSPMTFPQSSKKVIPAMSLNEEDNSNPKVTYENYIYKISQNSKLKKYYLVLINKDIFYYKSDDKKEVLGMHNLSGCFVKENGPKNINDKTYYCFTLVFPSKERSFYCNTKEIYDNFNQALKEAFGYQNFFYYYEMLDDLGEGIFGSVKLGVEKKTKERVAIKIIKKNKTKPSDIELVRTEIDVMKLCHHPNVVHLLDHFENAEYIFIVMEYIRGGRLTDYMKEKKYNFTEKRAAEIIYQIALGVKYLHKYGIIHRDLKPDNIMLTEASDKGQIKIMDFGLSKILGKKEKTVDGFGTLTFVSPEVLIRKPYNKEIDIWSIGVILYLLLSGDLPFDDEDDDEQKIAKSIVFNEVEFPQKKFGNKSKEVIDLIKGCLTKDPKNRIKVDEILKSEWIQSQIGSKD